MKVLMGAAIATMVLASAAMAQTASTTPAAPAAPVAPSRCAAMPAAPPPPDGATIAPADWEVAITVHNAWVEGVNNNLNCRAAEVRELRAQLEARIAEHTTLRSGAESANAALTVQQTIYCARPRMRCEASE